MEANVIIALIGVCGTLLGTVLGWLLNSFSGYGKLKVFVTSWEEKFQYNKSGYMAFSTSKEQTDSYWYELKLDIYNSSNDMKIMREITIEFLKGKRVTIVQIPYDDAATVFRHPIYSHFDVDAINISPKSIVQYKLCNGYHKEELDNIWISNKVILSYIDENNKKRIAPIASLEHDKYFVEIKAAAEND